VSLSKLFRTEKERVAGRNLFNRRPLRFFFFCSIDDGISYSPYAQISSNFNETIGKTSKGKIIAMNLKSHFTRLQGQLEAEGFDFA